MAEEDERSTKRPASSASHEPSSRSPESGDGHGDGQGRGDGRGEGQKRKEGQIAAPSLGPNTVIEREPVEERLARHEQSDVDAMGMDKRRAVVGQSLGPSKTRQIALYGIFLALVAAALIGGKLLVDALDTPVGKDVPNSAPWAQPDARQRAPQPLQ